MYYVPPRHPPGFWLLAVPPHTGDFVGTPVTRQGLALALVCVRAGRSSRGPGREGGGGWGWS